SIFAGLLESVRVTSEHEAETRDVDVPVRQRGSDRIAHAFTLSEIGKHELGYFDCDEIERMVGENRFPAGGGAAHVTRRPCVESVDVQHFAPGQLAGPSHRRLSRPTHRLATPRAPLAIARL